MARINDGSIFSHRNHRPDIKHHRNAESVRREAKLNYVQAERLINQLSELNKTLKVIASNQERPSELERLKTSLLDHQEDGDSSPKEF